MKRYRSIGVTVKSGLEDKDDAVGHILEILRELDVEIRVDLDRMGEMPCAKGLKGFREEDVDLILVIGGDGTILRMVRELTQFRVPILSVNRGTVGFLAEISLEEARMLLPQLLSGKGVVEERSLLEVTAIRGKKKFFEGLALNEAVIAQGTIARLVELEALVNGESLTTYHADGLIIATPTGSTAYNLAAGGPIVYPTLQAMILTPINPHSFSQKPIAIPGQSTVEVGVLTRETRFEETQVVLTIDGQTYVPLRRHDLIRARISRKTVKFLRRKQDTFFQTLRAKLKWGDMLEE